MKKKCDFSGVISFFVCCITIWAILGFHARVLATIAFSVCRFRIINVGYLILFFPPGYRLSGLFLSASGCQMKESVLSVFVDLLFVSLFTSFYCLILCHLTIGFCGVQLTLHNDIFQRRGFWHVWHCSTYIQACSSSLLSTTLYWLTKQDGLNRACKIIRGSFWSFWTFNWAALSIACYAIGCQNLTANSLNTTCSCGYRLFVESYPFSEPWVKTMFALIGFLDYFVELWMVTRLDCDSISPEAKQQITLIIFKFGMRGISQKF